jgi:hypothetical protein
LHRFARPHELDSASENTLQTPYRFLQMSFRTETGQNGARKWAIAGDDPRRANRFAASGKKPVLE